MRLQGSLCLCCSLKSAPLKRMRPHNHQEAARTGRKGAPICRRRRAGRALLRTSYCSPRSSMGALQACQKPSAPEALCYLPFFHLCIVKLFYFLYYFISFVCALPWVALLSLSMNSPIIPAGSSCIVSRFPFLSHSSFVIPYSRSIP